MDTSIFSGMALDFHSATPMYLQIAEYITTAIRAHQLPANTKLPPERQLALQCGVSRTTTINAYRKLEERGLVKTKIGSGTYVAEIAGETDLLPMPWNQLLVPQPPSHLASILRDLVSVDLTDKTISMATGAPDPTLYPLTAFHDLSSRQNAGPNNADMGYIPTEGYLPLREKLAAMHNQKGGMATANNIAVVSGSQQGLYLLAKVLINPGDYVITESPTYLGVLPIFRAAGARILTLPASGPLRLDLLEDYLIRYRPKLLYLLPTFQNPSGKMLDASERQSLLALAARHRLVIIEDDPYGELYYGQQPPPSLYALDPYGGVIYLSTFSKILFPGLRIGWIAASEAVINRVALEKQYVDLHSANLSQWQLHQYLAADFLPDHLATIRQEYRKRRDFTANALKRYCGDQLTFSFPGGGFYFWCTLTHPQATARHLLQEATRIGVSVVPGEAFYPDAEGNKEFRLCFATNREDVQLEGIKRLAKALDRLSKNYPSYVQSLAHTSRPII
ncbi:MAG: PLP-dependent aminotransferase family protein [Negativicutes bacterium]|nr:PLP-dependent aminotransferase family protein [Negativicutes bacterium]